MFLLFQIFEQTRTTKKGRRAHAITSRGGSTKSHQNPFPAEQQRDRSGWTRAQTTPANAVARPHCGHDQPPAWWLVERSFEFR